MTTLRSSARSWSAVLRRVGLYLGVVVYLLWTLLPLWFTGVSAVATPKAVTERPWRPIPSGMTAENFRSVLGGSASDGSGMGVSDAGSRLPSALWSSFLVAAAVVAISVSLGVLASYGLVRYRYRASGFVYTMILASRIVPAIAIVAPFFIAFRKAGLLGTELSLIISYNVFTLPLAVVLLTGYFRSLPPSVEMAAEVDGASLFTTLFRVVLPMAKPGIVAAALLVFLEAWSEFFFALTFASDLTVPPVLAGMQTLLQFGWPTLAAATVVSLVPPFVLAVALQKHLVTGLTSGAVK